MTVNNGVIDFSSGLVITCNGSRISLRILGSGAKDSAFSQWMTKDFRNNCASTVSDALVALSVKLPFFPPCVGELFLPVKESELLSLIADQRHIKKSCQ